ncbi:MAG: hypothetical protein QMB03_13190, partial [Spirosomataceae bacterium]
MKYTITFLALSCFTTSGFSQKSDSSIVDTTKFLRDKNIIVLPVVFSFPETGFGGGIVATSTFSFAKDSAWVKPSQASFGVTYTQNE